LRIGVTAGESSSVTRLKWKVADAQGDRVKVRTFPAAGKSASTAVGTLEITFLEGDRFQLRGKLLGDRTSTFARVSSR
jgi:hypothetical protein